MSIAGALATLLDVVDRDSKARCAEILGAAQAQAAALRTDAMAEGRRRLRAALRAERAAAAARIATARAQLEAEQRRAAQRRAALVVTAAEALLPAALRAVWTAQRRKWLEQALVRAAQSLPRDTWRIRHAPDLGDADRAWLRQQLDELGVSDTILEVDAGIDAGIEIRAGTARLEATSAGLLADRAWVYGRLLQFMEGFPAGPSHGGAANPPEPRSGEPTSPPAAGMGLGVG